MPPGGHRQSADRSVSVNWQQFFIPVNFWFKNLPACKRDYPLKSAPKSTGMK
jgi:hypothetical protein